jgi:hypothetical protein
LCVSASGHCHEVSRGRPAVSVRRPPLGYARSRGLKGMERGVRRCLHGVVGAFGLGLGGDASWRKEASCFTGS